MKIIISISIIILLQSCGFFGHSRIEDEFHIRIDPNQKIDHIKICQRIIKNPEKMFDILDSAGLFSNTEEQIKNLQEVIGYLQSINSLEFEFDEIYSTLNFDYFLQEDKMRRYIRFESDETDLYIIFSFDYFAGFWSYNSIQFTFIEYSIESI